MCLIPHTVIEFCLDRLEYVHSTAVKHRASECLGILSQFHLRTLCDILLQKLGSLKKDTEVREYVPYQRAVVGYNNLFFNLPSTYFWKVSVNAVNVFFPIRSCRKHSHLD